MQTIQEINAFLCDNAVPVGHKCTLVLASLTKRLLEDEMPANYRLQFLEHLEKMVRGSGGLTEEMIAAVQPMCEQGYEIVREAQSLGASKSLDVVAEVFPTFAMLNPSLVAALELSPQYQQLKRSA